MTKLAELLAAEKTPNGAWNSLREETIKKFKKESDYFAGHSKSLHMLEDNPQNEAIEAQAREERPVTATVYDTLEYALQIYGKAEDLQYAKNKTNQIAVGTVMWNGAPLLTDMPIDELLGLESRLTAIRQVFMDIPTLDASKHWVPDTEAGKHLWVLKYPEETTKTEKQVIPITMKEATKEHPAQVQPITKDVVVGKFKTIRRSGSATTVQKSEALKLVDDLLVEVKKARMRANETVVAPGGISDKILPLLLSVFKEDLL
jgi:hypothetical protein